MAPVSGRQLGAVVREGRVLRPAGAFHFMEHGLSPEETVARWQHRLTPLQRRVFGGCHINRPIDRLVVDAGLELTRQADLLGRWRMSSEAERGFVRMSLRTHLAEHFPELEAP